MDVHSKVVRASHGVIDETKLNLSLSYWQPALT